MEKRVENILREYELYNKKLVLAISGGIDSVVLLDILSQLLPKSNLMIAHLNHGLRKEAKEEERFVKDLSDRYGLSYTSKSLNLGKKDENTARTARYKFLRKTMKDFGAKYIVTAHHANDQLETILLKLTRGSGPVDLWGMKEESEGILRPLLSITREEIESYAKKKKLKYVEDASNNDVSYARNRLRHNVIPELLLINPNILTTVTDNSKLAEFLSSYIRDTLNGLGYDKVLVSEINDLHPFVARELIKRNLRRVLALDKEITAKNIESVYSLLSTSGTKRTEIGGKIIEKDIYYLYFAVVRPKKSVRKKLKKSGVTTFGDYSFKVRRGKAKAGENNLLLPLEFSDKLSIRTWCAGDKIVTPSGTKKIQDVFTDAKTSGREKENWPIVTSGKKILWVPFLAASVDAYGAKNPLKDDNDCLIIEVK